MSFAAFFKKVRLSNANGIRKEFCCLHISKASFTNLAPQSGMLDTLGDGLKTVGFIGLGKMGGYMANNLIKKGIVVHGFDTCSQTLADFEKQGGQAQSELKYLAKHCQAIITMLPNSPHVKQVFLDPSDGILEHISEGTLCIDSSTIDPMISKELGARVQEVGSFFIDAPVSGGVTGAEAGTLTFMVGGQLEPFLRAKPLLEKMGKTVLHCGGIGSGGAAKLANNLALAIQMTSVAEAMNLGVKLGLEPKVLAEIMNTSSGRCWSSDSYNPWPGVMDGVPASNNYKGGFATSLMIKDLGLALDAAKEVHASLPLGSSTFQLYNLLSQQGSAHKDFGVILELIRGKDAKS